MAAIGLLTAVERSDFVIMDRWPPGYPVPALPRFIMASRLSWIIRLFEFFNKPVSQSWQMQGM